MKNNIFIPNEIWQNLKKEIVKDLQKQIIEEVDMAVDRRIMKLKAGNYDGLPDNIEYRDKENIE